MAWLSISFELDPAPAQEGPVDEALLEVSSEPAQLPDQDPRKAGLGFASSRRDRLQAGTAPIVGAADAGVLDHLAGGTGAFDSGGQLGDLRLDRQLVLSLMQGRDSDVDNPMRVGSDVHIAGRWGGGAISPVLRTSVRAWARRTWEPSS